jgi:hypothetical protein
MQNSTYTIGTFPSPLYRAYSNERFARDFFERGSFILHNLKYFCDLEDVNRRDTGEGEGKVELIAERPVLHFDKNSKRLLSTTSEIGPVHWGTAAINMFYILCFSGPHVDLNYLCHKYGKHILRIDEPNKLVAEISFFISNFNNLPNLMWLRCVKVRYDKGQLINNFPELDEDMKFDISYGQKYPSFSSDCEYRLVLEIPLTNMSLPAEIKAELGKSLDYVNIVEIPSEKTNP